VRLIQWILDFFRAPPEWLVRAGSDREAMDAVLREGFIPGLNCTTIRVTEDQFRRNTWKVTVEYKTQEQPCK